MYLIIYLCIYKKKRFLRTFCNVQLLFCPFSSLVEVAPTCSNKCFFPPRVPPRTPSVRRWWTELCLENLADIEAGYIFSSIFWLLSWTLHKKYYSHNRNTDIQILEFKYSTHSAMEIYTARKGI